MARYRKHTVSYGDTVQHLAQAYLGDASQWQVITSYNKLEYPFIVDSVERKMSNVEGLVTYGDTIIIPVEQNLLDHNLNMVKKQDQEEIMALALGRDLDVNADSRHAEAYGSTTEIMGLTLDGDDLAIVSGAENLKQAVINRLLTPIGSLLLHPNYGSELGSLLGQLADFKMLAVIENEIMSTIKKDGRVSEVTKVESYIDGEEYFGDYKVTLMSFEDSFRLVVTNTEQGLVIV